jgi:MFS superfamily sulfate permease-like transporter
VDLGDLVALLPAAAGIALVTAADTIVLSRTFAVRNGYEADPNHELAAVGTANIAAGFFAGYPVSSSASRTAVAEAAGTRTQLTGVVGALAIAALVVLAPGLVADLPASALAAVVIAAAMSLADPGAFVRLWRQRPGELALALVTFLGVVVLGVIEGIFLAVLLSVLAFLRRAWWPHDAVLGRATGVKGYHDLRYYPEARQVPGLVLYRFDAPLLFFNGEAFRQRVLDQVVRAEPPARWVVVAAEPITDVDTTAAAALELLLEELATAGVTLAFAELKDPVKARLRRYGTMAMIGEDRCFPTVGTAVDAYVEATGETWVDWEEAGPEPAIPALPARPAPDARSGEAPGPNG